jgi:ABC-type sugar transport system permease subunit
MMEPNDPFSSGSALAQRARGRWRYFSLFGLQTIGAAMVYWTGLSSYRQILADPASRETHPWTFVWSLSGIALMQIAYWVSHHASLPLPKFRNVLLGHVILFLARMGFVLPTSVFGFVFLAQRSEFDIPVFRCLVILLGLFSLYCYVREVSIRSEPPAAAA